MQSIGRWEWGRERKRSKSASEKGTPRRIVARSSSKVLSGTATIRPFSFPSTWTMIVGTRSTPARRASGGSRKSRETPIQTTSMAGLKASSSVLRRAAISSWPFSSHVLPGGPGRSGESLQDAFGVQEAGQNDRGRRRGGGNGDRLNEQGDGGGTESGPEESRGFHRGTFFPGQSKPSAGRSQNRGDYRPRKAIPRPQARIVKPATAWR